MSEWQYKVRKYDNSGFYSINVDPSQVKQSYDNTGVVNPVRQNKRITLEAWLDWQSENGWELFKFHPFGWCVFRRMLQ